MSIETQVELGKSFIEKKGWTLVDTYSDSAISGTSFASRPGIQQLLEHVKREQIDVVLCVTVDRLSRDIEHSSKILKELRYRDIELWTVHAGTPVTDMELSIRAVLSHELVEQIRYRTREGMKTAVSKGKASTCLAYGYVLSQTRDANGDRVKGLRDIDPKKAEIVRRIFRMYADGSSPQAIAVILNKDGVEGPDGEYWRDTAIRGHKRRGSGILNNESYIGRIVWNRRTYRKNPKTEKRVARFNDASEWVVSEVPSMRIVSDELWERVRARDKEVGDLYESASSNRLNATHRPEYLLSHLLECAECGGPYAINGKDRYSCTNRKKHLPIDDLGGGGCSNSKTITRHEIEGRVLNCIPVAFFSMGTIDRVSEKMISHEVALLRNAPSRRAELEGELKKVEQRQRSIIQQISDRDVEGRPRLAALDDQLDELEESRTNLAAELGDARKPADDFTEKVARLKAQFNADNIEIVIRKLIFLARNDADDYAKQRLMPIVRDLIQRVVIGKTPGHQPATLQVHGSIANIMASMEVIDLLQRQFIVAAQNDLMEKLASGEIDTEDKKEKLLDAYAEELKGKYPEWANLQVSVVAGAGFEPAAFRL
ncbi:recombinase family protein [Rhizobium sp. 2YAF20]|uniref:recombinase family protein n=1 Tax=Rhizobium sp. 2YAF20 TaxID=3233027 RepID=UPI003F98842E